MSNSYHAENISMMFKEIITFYSQNPMKYVNTVCVSRMTNFWT